jgi:hypothetical protein
MVYCPHQENQCLMLLQFLLNKFNVGKIMIIIIESQIVVLYYPLLKFFKTTKLYK